MTADTCSIVDIVVPEPSDTAKFFACVNFSKSKTQCLALCFSFSLDTDTVNVASYPHAISMAHEIQRQATELGFKIELLNLGDGFACTDTDELSFDEVRTI